MELFGYSIPLILIGITELVKRLGAGKRLAPIINLVVSLLIFVLGNLNDIPLGIVNGIVASLISMGLFNATKSTIKGVQESIAKTDIAELVGNKTENKDE